MSYGTTIEWTVLLLLTGSPGLIIFPGEALAQAPANATMTAHNGQCSTFNVDGKEYGCAKVLHNYYEKNMNRSFTLDIPGGLLGVSGLHTESTSRSDFTLHVDTVTVLQDDGRDARKHPAKGTCSAKFSEDRAQLKELQCNAQFKNRKVAVKFAGSGEEGIELKSKSILEGVEKFYETYGETGIQGVVYELKDCYKKIRYNGDIEPLARCVAMDYVAYMIDSGMSGLVGFPNNKYNSQDGLGERVTIQLKRFGYDQAGTKRQFQSWVFKIQDWMRESGRL